MDDAMGALHLTLNERIEKICVVNNQYFSYVYVALLIQRLEMGRKRVKITRR